MITIHSWHEAGQARFFLAAMVVNLCLPLATQSIPGVSFMQWLSIPVVFVGLLFCASHPSVKLWLKPDVLIQLLFAMVLLFSYGMLLTKEAIPSGVWKDFARGIYFLALSGIVMVMAGMTGKAREMLKWFLAGSAFIAIAAGLLGALKYRMLLDGIYLALISSHGPANYPWGTSLVSDSNFFSLTLLIGALAILGYWQRAVSWKHALFWAALVGIVMTVGVYAGSRRFWVLAPLVLIAFLVASIVRHRSEGHMRKLLTLLAGAGLAASALIFAFSERASICNASIDLCSSFGNHSVPGKPKYYPGLNYSVRIATLTDKDVKFGAAPRLERWIYAFELLDSKTIWKGLGFGYRTLYGCKFLDCQAEDNPHNPFLSALLYGGVAALLTAVAFSFYALYAALALIRRRDGSVELGLGMLSALAFSMISGDTFFSMPVVVVMLIAIRLGMLASHIQNN